MIPLSEEEAGRALGVGALRAPVTGVGIDSRALRPGDLFVALKGERFDGHDFVAAAFQAGASGAVVEKRAWEARRLGPPGLTKAGQPPEQPGCEFGPGPVYEVKDTLAALGALAREVRRKSTAMVFAVTGSVGKTSTKDALAAMLGRVCRTVATTANENNEVGVPLTLLATQPDTEAVVVEMGMRGLGQIAALAEVAEPDIGVITNIHPVHLELLGSLEGIAQAKAELIAGVRAGGAVVVPQDCKILQPYLVDTDRRIVSFSAGVDACLADVQGWLERDEGGSGKGGSACRIMLRWPRGKVQVETVDMPEYRVENIVAAVAACYAARLPVEECAGGLAEVRFGTGRGQVLCLPGICVVDDTYNANPAAVRAALDDLVRLAAERGGRPVAVLGDMLELGPESERYHREIGRYAAEIGVECLWGVGERARAIGEGFREGVAEREFSPAMPGPAADHGAEYAVGEYAVGHTTARIREAGHVPSSEETSSLVASLRSGDVVLFKASRGLRLEIMVSRVVALAEAGAWATPADPRACDPRACDPRACDGVEPEETMSC
jgi:UDP-N-acetylmuramoyl-tripeptide--D-alanyl-D-alanine ligase